MTKKEALEKLLGIREDIKLLRPIKDRAKIICDTEIKKAGSGIYSHLGNSGKQYRLRGWLTCQFIHSFLSQYSSFRSRLLIYNPFQDGDAFLFQHCYCILSHCWIMSS